MNQVHKLIGNFVICPLFLLFILSLWYVQSILVITTECYSNHHPISGEFGWQDFTGQVQLLNKSDAAANMLYSWLFHTVVIDAKIYGWLHMFLGAGFYWPILVLLAGLFQTCFVASLIKLVQGVEKLAVEHFVLVCTIVQCTMYWCPDVQ